MRDQATSWWQLVKPPDAFTISSPQLL